MSDRFEGRLELPNGCSLYWVMDPAVGCRVYTSDEIGGGVHVWNTACVDFTTLLAAITQEMTFRRDEIRILKKDKK